MWVPAFAGMTKSGDGYDNGLIMLILYEFLLIIYVIIYFPILLLKGKWHGWFQQRFGFFTDVLKERLHHPRNIWVHAVSVGEVIAIAEFIRQLRIKLPEYQIVLSTTTKTGHELALKRLKDYATVLWAPLDFQLTTAAFIRFIQPKTYIVAETELWPNLFSLLHKKKIPILLLNGRISDNSYGRYQKIRWFMKRFLGYVDAFCMQSDEDAQRIIHLGAPEGKVRNIGNIKFDDLPGENSFTLENFGFDLADELWIAGSTHPGEEEIILNIFHKICAQHPRLRLVIAPRHIDRAADVVKLVESKGFFSLYLSQMNSGERNPNAVVVVDTIGHLRSLYSLGTLVFVGKSLTVKGGHNIIEPAFFSKPVIVGPFMQNFRDIMFVFKKDDAILQVQNAQELESTVAHLLDHPEKMKTMGQRARAVIDKHRGATARSVELVSRALNKSL